MRSRRDELSSLWQKVNRGGPSNLIFIRLSFSFSLRIFSDRESKQTINSCEASTAVLSLRIWRLAYSIPIEATLADLAEAAFA